MRSTRTKPSFFNIALGITSIKIFCIVVITLVFPDIKSITTYLKTFIRMTLVCHTIIAFFNFALRGASIFILKISVITLILPFIQTISTYLKALICLDRCVINASPTLFNLAKGTATIISKHISIITGHIY